MARLGPRTSFQTASSLASDGDSQAYQSLVLPVAVVPLVVVAVVVAVAVAVAVGVAVKHRSHTVTIQCSSSVVAQKTRSHILIEG